MIQEIVENLYSKGNITEKEFLKAVYELNKLYYIVRPKANSEVIKFIHNFNQACAPNHIKQITFKNTPMGFTVEEMFLKALAFNKNNPLEYMSQHAIFIPKTKEVHDYLNSIKTFNILIDNKDAKNPVNNEVKLFTPSTQGRLTNQFYKHIKKNHKNFINTNNRFPEIIENKMWISFNVVYNVEKENLEHGVVYQHDYYLKDNKFLYQQFINDIKNFFCDIDKKKNPIFEVEPAGVLLNGKWKWKYNAQIYNLQNNFDVIHSDRIYTGKFLRQRHIKALGIKGNKSNDYDVVSIECGIFISEDSFYNMILQ